MFFAKILAMLLFLYFFSKVNRRKNRLKFTQPARRKRTTFLSYLNYSIQKMERKEMNLFTEYAKRIGSSFDVF